MNLCVIGAGHVGLVSAACFAEIGNKVICVDNDAEKLGKLSRNLMPIYEPGLEELVKTAAGKGTLVFTEDLEGAVRKSEVVFVAVGTPAREDGRADLSYVEDVARRIARAIDSYKIIVEKSTVPVSTGEWIKRTLKLNTACGAEFDVASNPEFLREGTAIEDFMRPDRIVIGVESKRAEGIMRKLYQPLNTPLLVTDIKSSEIIKHASNSFLAMKISYINAISEICELAGADIEKVALGMGMDKRIGGAFLRAGIGYGGSCFPKDVSAFIGIAGELGYSFDLLKVVEEINRRQRSKFIKKVNGCVWTIKDKTIGVLGLSFKPDTDDMREAPSIFIIKELQAEGAKIQAYDPAAAENAKRILKDVSYRADPYEAARGCEALLILTEWNQFREMDLKKLKRVMATPVIIDGRNMFDPDEMKKLGFEYNSIGR